MRSAEEHRRLRHKPSQINVINPEGEAPYIAYTEDISKTNQGGLKSKKISPKSVIHHANLQNPSRCLVHLFIKYNQLCPSDRPDGALYLTPLKNQTQEHCIPIGHNKLANTVPRLMREAGIDGYFMNHSLRVTATTRLYDSQVDEASIMQRTGHQSVERVRAYKRSSNKLCEVTSAILYQEFKTVKNEDCANIYVKPVERNENSRSPQKNFMESMPWNFRGASDFIINFKFKC